jgi:hypothetical protein
MNALGQLCTESGHLCELRDRGRANGGRALEVQQKRFSPRGANPGQSIQATAQSSPVPDLAVVANRRIVRLVSQMLDQPKRTAVVWKSDGILHVG